MSAELNDVRAVALRLGDLRWEANNARDIAQSLLGSDHWITKSMKGIQAEIESVSTSVDAEVERLR